MIDLLLDAIVADDRARVASLLKRNPGLATSRVEDPRLFQAGIHHWLYVGDTPLHLAAAGHRVELVRALLTAGADPNVAGSHRGGRPLHYAADGVVTEPEYDPHAQVATIGCLLEAGADLRAQDKNGATPLHRAVRTRSAGAVECLLNAGAEPLARNHSGSTAFHLAVQNTGRGGSGDPVAIAAQRSIIALFLKREVSTKAKDGSGKTVAECARSEWIQQLLRGEQAQ